MESSSNLTGLAPTEVDNPRPFDIARAGFHLFHQVREPARIEAAIIGHGYSQNVASASSFWT